jgi:hypothetical protein
MKAEKVCGARYTLGARYLLKIRYFMYLTKAVPVVRIRLNTQVNDVLWTAFLNKIFVLQLLCDKLFPHFQFFSKWWYSQCLRVHISVRYAPPLFLRTYYKAEQEHCVLRLGYFVFV